MAERGRARISDPFVIGAVIELGLCLDLTTVAGIELVKTAFASLVEVTTAAQNPLPTNSPDRLRRNLDCAVIRRFHTILEDAGRPPVDTVKGVFTEGEPIYPDAGFYEKTHVQVAVRNHACIKGVFRVPESQITPIRGD